MLSLSSQSPEQTFDHRNFTIYTHMHACPKYCLAKRLGHSDVHLSNGSNFCYFLCAPLVPVWLSFETSHLAQLCHIWPGCASVPGLLHMQKELCYFGIYIPKIMICFKFSHFALFWIHVHSVLWDPCYSDLIMLGIHISICQRRWNELRSLWAYF